MAGSNVYLSTGLVYYAANTPTNPADEQVPYPTPRMSQLIAAAEPVGVPYDTMNISCDNMGNGDPTNIQNPDSGEEG